MSEVAKGCSHYLEYKKAHGLQSYRIIYRYLVKPSSEARKLKVCGVTEKLFEFCGPGLAVKSTVFDYLSNLGEIYLFCGQFVRILCQNSIAFSVVSVIYSFVYGYQ